jgi:signal transduction histidine kinase
MPFRLLRTANFKLALLYAVVFSISVLALGVLLYITIPQSMETQLKHRIDADMQQLLGDYHDDGINELRHDIRERMNNNGSNRLLYTIQNKEGRTIFDRLGSLSSADGWYITQQDVLMRVQNLDHDYILAVGADLKPIMNIKDTMLHGFAIAFLVTLCLGIAGGMIVSSRFLRRLDKFNRVAIDIGMGNLSQRMVISGTGDDFDQLSIMMNTMMDKIERLMHDIQHGATHIAHDLRTPLSRLRNHLEDARQHTVTDEHIDEAITQLDDVLDIFSALMRIAEIKNTDKTQGFTTIDLSSLVHHVVEIYSPVAEDQHKTIESHITPALRVYADRALLMQLLSNLIDNALKHGGDHITIETVMSRDDHHVRLSVSDNGKGIPVTERDEVLKPFYRLDHSRSTAGHGLGLGLVKAIADLHGATLELNDAQPGLQVILKFNAIG